ncbi:MAG TPA: peptide deformylase [Acidiferrobacteraceae bacterium]|nr:peptide deformylase [Acidiferrobacteraceae bacterium]
MSTLSILMYPDPRLYLVAKAVDEVDAQIRRLVDDMAQTMYKAPGVGLAAPQVDVLRRVIVIDTSEERNDLRVFINPEFVNQDGKQKTEEGCLSVPGIYDVVERYQRVQVRALNRDGEPFVLDAEGLLSVCIQHEMDHLDGKVFVDYLSPLKRERIRKKMLKQLRNVS